MIKSDPLIYFDEARHAYSYLGTWLTTSVTRVISDLTPEAKAQIEATKHGPDGWQVRGDTVHKALEQHLLFLAGESKQGLVIPEKWAEWIEPMVDHWLWEGCIVEAVELRLCDPEKSLGGSFDFLISDRDGNLVLGDLKTVRTKSAVDTRKPATAQLGAYVQMLNKSHKLYVNKCVTLVAGPGKTRLITEDPDHCVAEWEEALSTFNARQPDF
jgi:hypothetical protein